MAEWLVLGSRGQLGRDLAQVLAERESVGLDLPDIDITDPGSVEAALTQYQPRIVVNAAAYTAVDAAESDEGTATAVNGTAPGIIAAACRRRDDTRMVQVSTDYVFSGDADQPYDERATPDPRSAYGRSKLLGEQSVVAAIPARNYIVRTAWLYSQHGSNFVKTMLTLESQRDELRVVDDQWGQPTWSRDLARQIVRLVDSDAPAGFYHGTSRGQTSWYGFAREIFRLARADPGRVLPTTAGEFPRPAPRPAFSVLGHRAWREAGLEPIRPWDQALAEAMPLIVASM